MNNIRQFKYQSCKVRYQEQARVYCAGCPRAQLYLELLYFFHRLPNLNCPLGSIVSVFFHHIAQKKILKASLMSCFSFVFLARSPFSHVPLLALACHCLLAPPFYPPNRSSCLDLASLEAVSSNIHMLFRILHFFLCWKVTSCITLQRVRA